MNKINILDCTLRDGGYVNNWNFSDESMISILDSLVKSKIEFIECGFISQKKGLPNNSSNFRSIEIAEKLIAEIPSSDFKPKFCVMINFGEFPAEDLPVYNSNKRIKGVRLAFHKNDWKAALNDSKIIIEKGYDLFVQPMVTLSFSDIEIIEMLDEFNQIDIYAMYIVDSFGSMLGSDFRRLHYIFENNLKENVVLGYHSHNNLQLAYSNAIDFITIKNISREISIDSSIHGMGRGAGNLNTELFADFLNKKLKTNYNIEPLLETIDKYLETIYKENYWGYSIAHFLSAAEGCHPNYSSYLVNKKNLNIIDIRNIISQLTPSDKQNYKEDLISQLYFTYKSRNNTLPRNEIGIFKQKQVLIIASGPSVVTSEEKVNKFLEQQDAISVAVNHIPECCKVDFFFFSNQKRFDKFVSQIDPCKLIITSNVSTCLTNLKNIYDYHELISYNNLETDNVTLLLLNLLSKEGLNEVWIAGFDGYKSDSHNYSYSEFDRIIDKDEIDKSNKIVISSLSKIKKNIKINFLTESIFNN